MMKTVNDMYKYSMAESKYLLSNHNADYWTEYLSKHNVYDLLFNNMYKSFRYYNQLCTDSIDVVTNAFIEHVNAFLTINDKRYSELYKIHVLPDDAYSVTDNYSLTEVMDKNNTDTSSTSYGERIVSTNSTIGEQTNQNNYTQGEQKTVNINKVAPYDNETFKNESSTDSNVEERSDVSNAIIGSRNDSEEVTEGAKTDMYEDTKSENYTIKRTGNIGVKTATEIMQSHVDFWTMNDFYTLIFKELCAELLLI